MVLGLKRAFLRTGRTIKHLPEQLLALVSGRLLPGSPMPPAKLVDALIHGRRAGLLTALGIEAGLLAIRSGKHPKRK